MNRDDRVKLRALAKLSLEASAALEKYEDVPQLRDASVYLFRAAQSCTDAVLEDESKEKGRVA